MNTFVNRLVFIVLFFTFAQDGICQCYVRMEDASGFNTDPYQGALQAAAAKLCEIFDSTGFAGQFKVYDFGFYLHQENTTGGYPEAFAQKIEEVQSLSPYYLLFGKQTDKNGVYTKFWFALQMPTSSKFSCMTALQREVYNKRVQVKTENKYAQASNSYFMYHEAEIAGIEELTKIIKEIMECCVANRNGAMERSSDCEGCSNELANSYFDLDNYETYEITALSSIPADISKQGLIDISRHKITVNGSTNYIADIVDSLIIYLNTKYPLSVAITSNSSLCTTPTTEIESYLNQSGDGFKGWVNFSSTDEEQIQLKLRFYYRGSTTSTFTAQLNEILINHIKCEFSEKIALSGVMCENINVLNLHYYHLSANADYCELNHAFATAPIWLWPIIREIGIELVIELLKRQGGKVVQLPLNILEALRAIQQGDLFEFLDEAKDILANFSVPFKIFDAVWDAGELGWKANKVVGKVHAMYVTLGDAAMNKVWNAINKNFDVLKNFDVSGDNKALKLIGKSVSEFWDDLKIEFGVSVTPSDGSNGVYFQAGDVYFVNYPTSNSTGGPTIEIRLCKLPGTCSGLPTASNSRDLYKFRF
jgi:hypothetical protein